MATVLPPAGYSSWVWIIINTWWEFTMIPSGFQWLKTCKRSKKKTNQVMQVIWCILIDNSKQGFDDKCTNANRVQIQSIGHKVSTYFISTIHWIFSKVWTVVHCLWPSRHHVCVCGLNMCHSQVPIWHTPTPTTYLPINCQSLIAVILPISTLCILSFVI